MTQPRPELVDAVLLYVTVKNDVRHLLQTKSADTSRLEQFTMVMSSQCPLTCSFNEASYISMRARTSQYDKRSMSCTRPVSLLLALLHLFVRNRILPLPLTCHTVWKGFLLSSGQGIEEMLVHSSYIGGPAKQVL